MRIKFLFPLLGLILSCSLYQDTDLPDIFFEYHDFDILPLGRTFSDMIITENNQTVFLTDYNNNSIIKIDVNSEMAVSGEIEIGSHPVALDLNSDNWKENHLLSQLKLTNFKLLVNIQFH